MQYNLPAITVDPNTPVVERFVIENMQASEDRRYQTERDAYSSVAAHWVESNSLTRSISPDPTHYTPDAFVRPIPVRRQFVGWDGSQYVEGTPYTDPNIHPPVLPAWAPPSSAGVGSIKQLDAPPDPVQAKLVTIITMLMDIKAALHLS